MTKQIVGQAQWLIDEKLDELMEPISDENQRQLIQIDNVFSVGVRHHFSRPVDCWMFIFLLFQALGIITIEGIAKLRDYMLPHTKCMNCSSEFNQTTDSEASESTNACQHRFALERSTVLMHLENFLSEMRQQRTNKVPVEQNRGSNPIGKHTTISRLIDPADIQMFWKSYENFLSSETESLWNIIENGLHKYLVVST